MRTLASRLVVEAALALLTALAFASSAGENGGKAPANASDAVGDG